MRDLAIGFDGPNGTVAAVTEVSFALARGAALGLVGESGCGKSLTALALLGLAPRGGRILRGSIRFRGEELLELPERSRELVRGGGIGLVFQEPGSALHPARTVGDQIGEVVRVHRGVDRATARQHAGELLEKAGLADAGRIRDCWPHELSGGMKQRVALALALAGGPALLVADEPTSALDGTIQAQLLALLDRLRRDEGLAILLISHDLAVVAELCDEVAVMYSGRIVESGPTAALLAAPRHPYTRGLLAARPRLDRPPPADGRLPAIPGLVPDPVARPAGCAFHPRCPLVQPECRSVRPPLLEVTAGRRLACPHADAAASSRA